MILRIRFYLLLKSISFCFLLFKVFFDGFAMREVIGDGRVDVAEIERRKALRNLFGGGAQFEMMNDGIQTNSRTFHTNGAMFGDGKRNAECFFKSDHKRVDYT